MHPTIAIFEFLKIREPVFVFSFIGIKLAPYEICFNLSLWNLLQSLQSSTSSTAKTEI